MHKKVSTCCDFCCGQKSFSLQVTVTAVLLANGNTVTHRHLEVKGVGWGGGA